MTVHVGREVAGGQSRVRDCIFPLASSVDVDTPATWLPLMVDAVPGDHGDPVIVVTALVGPGDTWVKRRFQVVATGHQVPGDASVYLGTVDLGQRWHVFDCGIVSGPVPGPFPVLSR